VLAAKRAFVSEIFLSAQGEGMLVGERQIFLRLAGCNIRCPWCDTPEALVAKDSPSARIETAPGAEWHLRENPLAPEDVLGEVTAIARSDGRVRWVALTGGEPMIWRGFLEALLPGLRRAGLRTFLETNSHYPETLRALLRWIDFVSADVKVPFADYEVPKERYVEFFSAVPRGDLQVKVVVTADCPGDDVVEAARLVARVDRDCPFVIQPVTPHGLVREAPSSKMLLDLQRRCLEILDCVRVIPQTHKLYGAR
jgi:organic radical activating enzyme